MRGLIPGLIMLFLFGCKGGGRNLEDDDDTAIRSGEEIPIENQEFYDAKPSLSADGTRLTFVSGRDKQLKIYKYSTADGMKARRVTEDNDKLSDEFEASLSPDGSLVALVGAKDGTVDVHIKGFDDGTDLITVPDKTDGIESRVSFSHDGALVTFVRRSNAYIGARVFVAAVDSSGAVSDVTEVSKEGEDEDFPVFIATSTAGQYRLLTVRRSTTTFEQAYVVRDLSIGGGITIDAESATPTTRNFLREVGFTPGLGTVYFSTRTDRTGQFNESAWEPLGPVATDDKVAVQSVLATYDVDNERSTKFGDDLGIAVLSVSSATVDAGALMVLTREAWTCEEGKLTYATRLKIISAEDGSAILPVLPKYKDKKFSGVSNTVCVTTDKTEVDDGIVAGVINGGATPDNFVVAYVSLYPQKDNEVRLLTYDGSVFDVKEVSLNRAK